MCFCRRDIHDHVFGNQRTYTAVRDLLFIISILYMLTLLLTSFVACWPPKADDCLKGWTVIEIALGGAIGVVFMYMDIYYRAINKEKQQKTSSLKTPLLVQQPVKPPPQQTNRKPTMGRLTTTGEDGLFLPRYGQMMFRLKYHEDGTLTLHPQLDA